MKLEQVKGLSPEARFWLTGVYQIRNRKNGKVYVGSAAIRFSGRWGRHRKLLRENRHFNSYLQSAWNKHGEKTFAFEVLEKCPKELCTRRENYWISRLRAADRKHGYNLYPTARSPLGVKRPKSVGLAVAAANRLRIVSAETRAKMSRARKAAFDIDPVQVRRLSSEGKSNGEISLITGVGRTTIYRILNNRKGW